MNIIISVAPYTRQRVQRGASEWRARPWPGSPALFAPENLLQPYFTGHSAGGQAGPAHTDCKTEDSNSSLTGGPPADFNGFRVATFQPRAETCTVTIAGLDLAASPASGAAVYFLVQARLWDPAAVRLTIDPGRSANGSAAGARSGPEMRDAGGAGEWRVLTFHGTLGASGTATFGLTIEGGPVSPAFVGGAVIIEARLAPLTIIILLQFC
jgi:hypothetical protein